MILQEKPVDLAPVQWVRGEKPVGMNEKGQVADAINEPKSEYEAAEGIPCNLYVQPSHVEYMADEDAGLNVSSHKMIQSPHGK